MACLRVSLGVLLAATILTGCGDDSAPTSGLGRQGVDQTGAPQQGSSTEEFGTGTGRGGLEFGTGTGRGGLEFGTGNTARASGPGQPPPDQCDCNVACSFVVPCTQGQLPLSTCLDSCAGVGANVLACFCASGTDCAALYNCSNAPQPVGGVTNGTPTR
jgi:hypothetical protein